jgi:hypothetical protein
MRRTLSPGLHRNIFYNYKVRVQLINCTGESDTAKTGSAALRIKQPTDPIEDHATKAYATRTLSTTLGTGAGSGEPSATNTASATFGTGAGSGEPSATITASVAFGTGAGSGEPSTTFILLVKLTDSTTGATINPANARTAAI